MIAEYVQNVPCIPFDDVSAGKTSSDDVPMEGDQRRPGTGVQVVRADEGKGVRKEVEEDLVVDLGMQMEEWVEGRRVGRQNRLPRLHLHEHRFDYDYASDGAFVHHPSLAVVARTAVVTAATVPVGPAA